MHESVCTCAFFVKEGEIYKTVGQLAGATTLLIFLIMMVLVAVALQHVLDNHNTLLNMPLPQNASLDWIDYSSGL